MPVTNLDELVLDKQAKISSADAKTQTATYSQADVNTIVTLVNEIKTKLNTIFKG